MTEDDFAIIDDNYDTSIWEAWIKELQNQIKMLNEKISFYEAKIRRLECEVRLSKASG